MATIPLHVMRQEVFNYYKKRGWNFKKVDNMPNNQLVAIYYKLSKQGFKVPNNSCQLKIKEAF